MTATVGQSLSHPFSLRPVPRRMPPIPPGTTVAEGPFSALASRNYSAPHEELILSLLSVSGAAHVCFAVSIQHGLNEPTAAVPRAPGTILAVYASTAKKMEQGTRRLRQRWTHTQREFVPFRVLPKQ